MAAAAATAAERGGGALTTTETERGRGVWGVVRMCIAGRTGTTVRLPGGLFLWGRLAGRAQRTWPLGAFKESGAFKERLFRLAAGRGDVCVAAPVANN